MLVRYRYVLSMLVCAMSIVANTAPAVSLYQIGNSLTWDSQPQATVETAANQGITLSSGYHIRSSSSLLEIYKRPYLDNDSIRESLRQLYQRLAELRVGCLYLPAIQQRHVDAWG